MKNYKQKEYFRVLKNTTSPSVKAMNDVVGGVFEVKARFYVDNTVSLWNESKTDYWYFHLSDLQKVYDPSITVDGHIIGEDDEVKYLGYIWIVYDVFMYDGEWRLCTYKKEDEKYCLEDTPECFSLHKPLYKTTTETIEIGGKKYDKKEFENAVKDLKAVN